MTRFKLLFLTFIALSCSRHSSKDNNTGKLSPHLLDQQVKVKEYSRVKSSILHFRDVQREIIEKDPDQRSIVIHNSRELIESYLIDSIFPYWINTKWDYNGTSETPGEGAIACGYFVTTCLRDCGLKIERVKLAQQASLRIMQTICDMSRLRRIGHNDFNKLLAHLKAQEDGVFILGLDNHVGFVVKSGREVEMVHSNGYRGHSKVEIEDLDKCDLVLHSTNYFLAPLFTNDNIIMQWINSAPIPSVLK